MYLLWLFVPFYVYLHFLFPTIYGGDSSELITAGVVLGAPHAPGYPVYCLLAKLFSDLIIFGNKAFRINTLSAVISCVNAWLLFLLVKNIVRNRYAAFASAAIFIFLPINFEQSLGAEVFGLNLLFFLLIIVVLSGDFGRVGSELFFPKYYLAGFIFGFGMGNHQTLSFVVPGAALFVYFELGRDRFLRLITKPAFYLFSCMGLSVYLYLLIRAQADPAINFGNPDTLKRLWAVFSRQEFGSFELHPAALKGRSVDSLMAQALVYLSTLLKEFGIFGLCLTVAGFIFGKKYRLYLPLVVVFLLAGPIFIFYSNLSPNALASWRLERFYLLPMAILCIFIGIAFHAINKFISNLDFAPGNGIFFNSLRSLRKKYLHFFVQKVRKYNQVFSRVFSGWVLPVILAVFVIISGARISETRENFYFHDFAKNITKGIEKRGMLLMDRILFDEYGSGVAYLTQVLCRRRDLHIIMRSGTMFGNIYGEDYFDLDSVGRRQRRKKTERVLLNGGRKVFHMAVMNKHKANAVSELYCNGLIYRSSITENPLWFAYVRRDIMPKRTYPLDYPTRLILAHYPYFQGKCGLEKGKLQLAGKYFIECREHGYDFEWLMFNIGSVYSRENDLKKALYYYEKALSLDPFFPDTYFGLGYVYLSQGEFKAAEGFLEECIKLDGHYSQAYYNLGFVKYKLGKAAEAKENFRIYFKYEPGSELKEGIKSLGIL